jgi:beta-galactosidase
MSTSNLPRHQRPTNLKEFLFGAPYYPEHWTEADRQEDPAHMAAAGVNAVRIGEFAWDRMEPEPGKIDFSFFDEQIARLGAAGVGTILCTPTATPPRWLTVGHPDWMRIDESGKRMDHGNRQHCCTTNEEFRAESRRITSAMAGHFAGNPHVIGWQTDNELNCHFQLCFCKSCVAGFQDWLRAKYASIDKLNGAWGNAFWALSYNGFEQIPLPYPSGRPAVPNPSHELDYYRFVAEAVREFQRQQVEILRKANANWFITHNGLMGHVDYWEFTKELDFLGADVYPAFGCKEPADSVWMATYAQKCRAASGGFIVPEQQAGPGGQKGGMSPSPRPGQMRLWAYQSIAHGADGVLHFRWRTCRFGAEEFWCGVLDHDNVPRRRYQEFARAGAELKRIGGTILHTVLDVQAAALIEQDQDEAHLTYPLNLPSPSDQANKAYREFWRRHLPAGLVNAQDSFDGLKLLVVPSLLMMDDVLAGKLTAFAEGGGVLVVTARTATKNRDNQCIAQTPPGALAALCGAEVVEFGPVPSGQFHIDMGGGASVSGGPLYEILQLRGAQAVGRWTVPDNYGPCAPAGQVAVSLNRVGKGAVFYVGTFLTDENAKAIFDLAMKYARITPLAQAPEAVELTRRRDGRHSLVFVLNHHPYQQTVRTSAGMELISGTMCDGNLELPPFGVAVIEESTMDE